MEHDIFESFQRKISGSNGKRKRQYRFSERNIPIGNSCSISSKSSLILVSGLRGRVSVNGTDFYKW